MADWNDDQRNANLSRDQRVHQKAIAAVQDSGRRKEKKSLSRTWNEAMLEIGHSLVFSLVPSLATWDGMGQKAVVDRCLGGSNAGESRPK